MHGSGHRSRHASTDGAAEADHDASRSSELMALRPRQPAYNPNAVTLDDGRTFDTTGLGAVELSNLGAEQDRLRQAENGPFPTMINNLPGFGMGNYFGLLQGKENYARSAGKSFGVDFAGGGPGSGTGFGTWKAQVNGGPSINLESRTMASPAMRSLGARAGYDAYSSGPGGNYGAGDAIPGNIQRYLNEALVSRAQSQADLADDQSLDSAFANDPYRNQQIADNAAATATTMGRAKFGLEQEQNDARVGMAMDALRRQLGIQEEFKNRAIAAAQPHLDEQAREKGLFDLIAKAYGKDPLAAEQMFKGTIGQSDLFRRAFGGGAAAPPPSDTERLIGDMDQNLEGYDPSQDSGFRASDMNDLVNRGGPVAGNDLVNRDQQDAEAALRQRGIPVTPENVQRLLQRRMQRLGGGIQSPQ